MGLPPPPRHAGPPLAGIGVIVTRPVRQAAGLVRTLDALGARSIVWPAIVILPPGDDGELARAHAALHTYDIAIFVSANAVEFGAPDPARWPAKLAIYAPGRGTADAITDVGLPAACVPETTFDSDGLLALPPLTRVDGRRVVIFRGEGGRAQLADTLRARGATVDTVTCYRRAAPSTDATGLARTVESGAAHVLTLTSAEGLANLLRALDPHPARRRLAALATFAAHPRIVEAARAAGLDARTTLPGNGGLVAALLEWAAGSSRAPEKAP
jgi:uroporphyrinogen-III synthase